MAEIPEEILGVFNFGLTQFVAKRLALDFKIKNLETEANDPWDLTQFSEIELQVRLKPNAASKLHYIFKLGDGLTITGDNNEILILEVPAAFYQAQMQERYYYDILFKSSIDNEFTILIKGEIKIDLRISKPS